MHAELARRRVYLHTARWTSLGLSLIEAMMLGMPVVVVGTTEAPERVPPAAGVVSADLRRLRRGLAELVGDPDAAAAAGRAAREAALARFGVERFLRDWEDVLARVTETPRTTSRTAAVPSPALTGRS
jgi:glycosyltransferase involved in cell wall biosynthesis